MGWAVEPIDGNDPAKGGGGWLANGDTFAVVLKTQRSDSEQLRVPGTDTPSRQSGRLVYIIRSPLFPSTSPIITWKRKDILKTGKKWKCNAARPGSAGTGNRQTCPCIQFV